jgi:EAL domain-containing protein (putative c-di-GMP-specific phosphodiesterase class I)
VTFAFQPIIDVEARAIFAYEALVRGRSGESAKSVLGHLAGEQLERFDRDARIEAVRLAASLGLTTGLSLNFLSRTLESLPDAITSTLAAAKAYGLSASQLILEVTEDELIADPAGFAARINAYRAQGLRLALDDFGAGYAGLNLLADFQPDIVKLDMHLVRDIDSKGPRQAIIKAILLVCRDLGLDVLAEGVETESEFRWLERRGVTLFQGYLFGKPALGRLPEAYFPTQASPEPVGTHSAR